MLLYICNKILNNTQKIMTIMTTLAIEKMNETTLKLAIECYSELSKISTEDIILEIKNGNKIIVESILKLMFMAA